MPALVIDFHTHLLEKKVKPLDYWKAVKAKKLDAVAITEHAQKKPKKAYYNLLQSKPEGVTLIPGIELETEIGHVLALSENEGIYSRDDLLRKNLPIKKAVAIGEKEGILLSISHPWGFSYDSAAYLLGEKKLQALVEKEKIGIEAFNGMFGNVSSFFYASSWVRKPMNFFDFLEKSTVGKKTRLSKLAGKGKEKLDSKAREIIERCSKPFELAEKAWFATAGSDAHKPDRIGTGIIKLQAKSKKPKTILEALLEKKNIEWIGPYVKETANGLKVDQVRLHKTEILSGIKYAAKRAIIKKAGIGKKRLGFK